MSKDRRGSNKGQAQGLIPFSEVAKHNTKGDCWVVIKNKVYDLTSFVPDHPGGPDYVARNAGKDGTADFLAVHNVDIIRTTLGAKLGATLIGEVDPATIPESAKSKPPAKAAPANNVVAVGRPPLGAFLNIFDFERVAQKEMLSAGKDGGWAYYSSGGDDEITLQENHAAFQRVWLKPRVMVDVGNIDTSTTMMGYPCTMPMFLSSVAMCGLGHDDGEVAWTRAAYNQGIFHIWPTLGSKSLEDLAECREHDQVCFFQLYVNPDRQVAKAMIKDAEAAGVRVLFITVDAPQLGNREKDRRTKAPKVSAAQSGDASVDQSQGTSKALTSFIDPSLNWSDLKWFRSVTKMRIVLKGVQSAEDAKLAAEYGVDGILVSNHGGRQMDCCRSSIEILPEVMAAVRAMGAEDSMEVYLDGGVRRGSDIYKALALGAKAVGIGRPALFGACSGYGQEGIEKVISILRDELIMTMRLMGAPTVEDISPKSLILDDLPRHLGPPRLGHLESQVYLPPAPVGYTDKAEAAKDSDKAEGAEESYSDVAKLVLATAAKGFLTTRPAKSIQGTGVTLFAMLLLYSAFCVVTLAAAPKVFNDVHILLRSPLGLAVQGYAVLSIFVHALAGSRLSFNKRRAIVGSPLTTGILALTGTATLAFLAFHYYAFWGGGCGNSGKSAALPREFASACFQSPEVAFAYFGGLFAVAYHLWFGWPKTCLKWGTAPPGRVEKGRHLVVAAAVGLVAVVYGFYANIGIRVSFTS